MLTLQELSDGFLDTWETQRREFTPTQSSTILASLDIGEDTGQGHREWVASSLLKQTLLDVMFWLMELWISRLPHHEAAHVVAVLLNCERRETNWGGVGWIPLVIIAWYCCGCSPTQQWCWRNWCQKNKNIHRNDGCNWPQFAANLWHFQLTRSGPRPQDDQSYYLQLFPSPCVLWVQLFHWWEGTSIFLRATTREQLWRQYSASLKASADISISCEGIPALTPSAKCWLCCLSAERFKRGAV